MSKIRLARCYAMTLFVITMLFTAGEDAGMAQAPKGDEPLRVGLILDKGGRDDKSFNAAAFLGANKAKTELRREGKTGEAVTLKVVEAADDNSFEPMLRNFARAKFDLIISIGFAQAEALNKVAAQNADRKFVIVDAEVKQPNVSSLMFQEHEGGYLVGAIAALSSKTRQIGFIGGMDIPLIRRFLMGYEAGIKSINPKANLITHYVGVTSDSWNNPPRAKELALAQYAAGVDIIFGAAGASNMGILDAAEEKKLFAIGVDSNQNGIKPGRVLTSMLKRVDIAVYDAIQSALEGKFKPGVRKFGLSDKGVDFALDEHNQRLLPPATLEKISQIKAAIIAGQIKVPDAYERASNRKN
jgi:basic membrane protein A